MLRHVDGKRFVDVDPDRGVAAARRTTDEVSL